MYAAIRRYNIAPGSAGTIADRVNADFLPQLATQAGFVSYQVIDPGDGTIVSVSIFEDRAGVEASTRLATEWVRSSLASMIRTAPVIVSGEVLASRVGATPPSALGARS